MVADNPYIVKETEGNAYTIRQFVTGRPLTAGELLPDEHGIHPVNPLGFGMAPDGSVLETAEPTMGMMAYPIYYGDMYGIPAPTPEDEGKPVPPEVLYGYVKYHLAGPYSSFSGTELKFPVLSVSVDEEDSSVYVVLATGDIRDCDDDSHTTNTVKFYNVTTDDYEPTGLTSEDGFRIDSITVENGVSTIKILNQSSAPFAGIVGPGKLGMYIVYDNSGAGPNLVSIRDNEPDTANGIFLVGKFDGEPFRKVCELPEPTEEGGEGTDGGPTEEIPECNARNGYGSSEVRNWITRRIGGMVEYGKHPSQYPGDLVGAGAFVQWFVSCSDVDVSGGVGNNQVMVPGFGLGSGYFRSCISGDRAPLGTPSTDVKQGKWLTFGYGTAHDDVLPNDNSKPVLPMDWPFTDNSDYADTTVDNSITLVKKGVLVDDTVYGRLNRIDPECPRCNGYGIIVEGSREDKPCPVCRGAGEVPECSNCGGTGKVGDADCPACLGSGRSADCDVCGGTGTVNGYRCSVCGGTGKVHGMTVEMNKVHVCLFNDFEPSTGDDGEHVAGTTVLKKTFVNLATPISTKDGDEFEITVSLPNVSQDKAFRGDDTDDLKNLSGYYAYISQPRVYVMSGTWKFSETRVDFTMSSDLTVATLNEEFLDSEGNPLPDDTEVRVKMSFGSYTKKEFDMTGVLTHIEGEPGIELYDAFDVDDNVKRLLAIPPTRKTPNYICGAAYVEPNNDTLPEGSTPLGLNAVRSENGPLGVDYGETDGGVEQYNKLYTADQDDGTRHHVLFDDEGNPKEDQRQVVATVYPTVTNTFPWSLTHRRKQYFLEKLMTMDADLGCDSMFARLREMNRDILSTVEKMGAVKEYKYYMFEVSKNESLLHPELYPYENRVCEFSKLILNTANGSIEPSAIVAENSNATAEHLFEDGYEHSPWVSGVLFPDMEPPEGYDGTGWFIMEFDTPVTLTSYKIGPNYYGDPDNCTEVLYYAPRSWRLCGSNEKLTDPKDSRWVELDVHVDDETVDTTCEEVFFNFNITYPVAEEDKIQFTPNEYPLDMAQSKDYIARLYGHGLYYGQDISDKISFIGAVMSVLQADEPLPDLAAQPVRQAIKAVKMLSHDFRNSRARWTDYSVTEDSSILADASPIDSTWDISSKPTVGINKENTFDEMANKIKLSHLPEFIAAAGTSETGEPISALLNAYPYLGDEYAYYYSNPYEYDEYGTTNKISDTPCEVTSNSSTRVFSVNSIVTACVEKNLPWMQSTNAYDDMLRAAELAAFDFGDDNILRPHLFRAYAKPWMEPIDAFTKILSPDNIPAPQVEQSFTYENVGLTEEQYAFVSGDAYGYYKILNDWTSISNEEFISTNLPTDDSLAEFLKEYISSYGACMTARHWNGFRVKVKSEPTDQDKKTHAYLSNMAWNGVDCDDSYRGEYAADAFIVDDAYTDPNLNRTIFRSAYEALSMDYSVPPYSCTRNYRKQAPFATREEQDAVGYIRVFMKFTFCADAGRWYCVDYRQAPISYLSPLYGAKALEETINGHSIWIPPGCGTFSWRDATNHTYEEYRPMGINPALVPDIVSPRTILEQTEPIEYIPSKNRENSCINGVIFEPDPNLLTYHVSLDLDWTNFNYLEYPDNFDCWFQGASYRQSYDSWEWTGANAICTALNNVMRPKDLILSNQDGTYHYETDFEIDSYWFYDYSKCYVGLRTDYSNGRGMLAIRNMKVTNLRNKLSVPYLPVDEGGLGLNAPLNKYGTVATGYDTIAHANFWSVRPHLRPATGAVAVGSIPHYYRDEEMFKIYEDDGGIMADSVLWGQYDYPEKNAVEYHLPDTIYPDADLAETHLVYAKRNSETRLMDSGHIQLGNHPNIILGIANPSDGSEGSSSGDTIIAQEGVDISLGDGISLAYH